MSAPTLPTGPPAEEPATEPPRPEGVIDRLFGNRFVLLGLLLALLGWVAVTRVWLFVLIVAIVASVFLHEMGHFLMAKRNGMKVTEFFIGFGPRIWSFRRGETEYGLKLVPAGAYVRIIGMHNLEDLRAGDEESRTYRAQSYWRRMPVVLAGPVMNLALGFVLLVIVFAGFGHPSADRWRIATVSDASAAQSAGLEPGDRIVSFDGAPVGAFEDFTPIVRAHGGTAVDLEVERDGSRIVVPVTIGWMLDTDGARVLANLLPGDRVVAVDDTQISTYDELAAQLASRSGPARLTLDRNGRSFTTTVDAPVTLPTDGSRGFLGVSPESVLVRSGVVTATGEAASAFGETITGSVSAMGRIFSPSGIGRLASQVANGGSSEETTGVEPLDSGAPSGTGTSTGGTARPANADRPMSLLGIVNIGTQLGEETGWAGVLALLATVNIFLGLINLVPLLPFDGGHIAVATYEEIRTRMSGRPHRVDMARLMPVTYVVVLLMVGLFASTLYLDAVDPVQLSP